MDKDSGDYDEFQEAEEGVAKKARRTADNVADDEEEEDALLRPGRVLRSYGAGDKEPHEQKLESGESTSVSRPWKLVWPYRRASDSSDSLEAKHVVLTRLESRYPYFDICTFRSGTNFTSFT